MMTVYLPVNLEEHSRT